jgi:hypothetical protein
MLDIYAHQGAAKAIEIMKLNKTQNQAGQLFRITHLWWQYEIGTENSPLKLQQNPINFEYSNSIWFTEICKFLTSFKIFIHIRSTWPLSHRENNRYIMDIAQEPHTPTKAL